MRTTVNLDEDVAKAVDRLRKEMGLGLSDAVNELIRGGLAKQDQPKRRRFRQRTQAVGIRIDVTNVAEALDLLEGPAAR